MSKFLTKLVLENVDDKDNGQWILVEPLVYMSDLADQTFTVPKGFKTDLASVPRLPIIFLLTGDTSSEAAVIHDYLYTTRRVARKMADGILKEASKVTGVPNWRRNTMWAGVRAFGWTHWNKTR